MDRRESACAASRETLVTTCHLVASPASCFREGTGRSLLGRRADLQPTGPQG